MNFKLSTESGRDSVQNPFDTNYSFYCQPHVTTLSSSQ